MVNFALAINITVSESLQHSDFVILTKRLSVMHDHKWKAQYSRFKNVLCKTLAYKYPINPTGKMEIYAILH